MGVLTLSNLLSEGIEPICLPSNNSNSKSGNNNARRHKSDLSDWIRKPLPSLIPTKKPLPSLLDYVVAQGWDKCCYEHRYKRSNDSELLYKFKNVGRQCDKEILPRPNKFKVVRELGSGSMGTNYKAVTVGGNVTVSLKVGLIELIFYCKR